MMHDTESATYHQAIMRHAGEATKVRERYERFTPGGETTTPSLAELTVSRTKVC
jgi:hypothetical protein